MKLCIGIVIVALLILIAILFFFIQIKRDNKKLKQEIELKSQLLATISHELRTPLTAIIGYAELMETVKKDYSRQIVLAAEQLLTIVNDILDLSKMEAGKYELVIEAFDLRNAISSSIQMLRVKAEQQGIDIVFNSADTPVFLEGDEKRIRQVIINLLNNAIKFSPAGGKIVFTLWEENRYLFFSIKDEGIGIEPEDLEKIFEPFYQIGDYPGKKEEGTGLGLPLAKQIIEIHQGEILVTSKPGKGSTFTVKLPKTQVEN